MQLFLFSLSSLLVASRLVVVVVVANPVFLCSMFERKDCVRPWILSLPVPIVRPFSLAGAHTRELTTIDRFLF